MRLAWVAPDDLRAWTEPLDAAGFDLRSTVVAEASGVARALRDPLDLVVAWDDPAGERAGEVVAAVVASCAAVPVAVVSHPNAEPGLLRALDLGATVALERGRPRALPGELARLLAEDWSTAQLALTGRIAHELNNLLAPIPLAVKLLQQPGEPASARAQLAAVDTATRRSMRALKGLSEVLAAHRPTRLTVLAKHLVNLAAASWRRPGDRAPEVLTEYPPDLAPVRVEPRLLLQLLWCLARRTLDAVGAGSAQPPELLFAGAPSGPLAAGGEGVEIRVLGAAAATLATEAPKVPGRAPRPEDDLAAIVEIVEAHGGELAVLEGDRDLAGYVLRLPAVRSPGAAGPAPSGGDVSPSPPSPRLRARAWSGDSVLLIEGDGENRRATQETLERSGRRVLVAGDGTEGVALFAEHVDEVGAVLVDMALPYMDGVTTIRALRRIGGDVPMVLTTGEDWDPGRVEAGPEAPDVVLRRPYDPASLLAALRSEGEPDS